MNKHELKLTNERLEYLGEGAHKCGFFKGWIHILKFDEYISVMSSIRKLELKSSRYKGVAIHYHQDHVGLIFDRYLEWREVDNKRAKKYYAKFLEDKILKAYVKKFNSVPSRYKLFTDRIKKKLTDKFNTWLVKPDKRIPGVSK